MANTILSAVQDAAETLSNDSQQNNETKTVESSTKETSQNTEGGSEDDVELQDDSEKPPEHDPEEVKQALEIWNILKDPDKQKRFVKSLAASFDEDTKDMSPTQKKEVADDLMTQLKKEIGEHNDYLLEPMLKVVNRVTNQLERKFANALNEIEVRNTQRELSREYSMFMEVNEVSAEEQAHMEKLAKEFPPSPELSLTQYLTKIRRLAKSEAAEKQRAEEKKEQRKKNFEKDKFQKGRSEQQNKTPATYSNPKDAVMAAVRELQGD